MNNMRDRNSDDPVVHSIAAYSTDPIAYEKKYANHLLDRPQRFLSLLPAASRILDLGCGPGRDLRLFTEAGHHPVGIELNPSFIEMARHHGDVIDADIRDIAKIFPHSSFDGVWAQASLVHLSKEEIENLLIDIASLLAPSGWFYACVPATGVNGWWEESDGRRWYTVWPDSSFPTAVTQSGFNVVDVVNGPYVEVWARKP